MNNTLTSFESAPTFSSPEQEIEYLRSKIKQQEDHQQTESLTQREANAETLLKAYAQVPIRDVVAPEQQIQSEQAEGISLALSPEEHDDQIGSLYHLMLEKGLRNTFAVIERLANPHLADDFHRFLVQYLLSNDPALPTAKKGSLELLNDLATTLFEITLPSPDDDTKQQTSIKEVISAMEQFYAGMNAITAGEKKKKGLSYALEIGLPNSSGHIVFYASVPNTKTTLFEKHVLGLYPHARVTLASDDYNVFDTDGQAVGAYATSTEHEILPLKTYEQFDHDPLDILVNVFSKLQKEGEGAALQFVISTTNDATSKKFQDIHDAAEKGSSLKDAIKENERGVLGSVLHGIIDTFSDEKSDEEKSAPKAHARENEKLQKIREKLGSHISPVTIRVVASAHTTERAQEILHDITSAFHQFTDVGGNGITFVQVSPKKSIQLLHDFTYRLFRKDQALHLNHRELATLYHFPATTDSAPELKQARAASAPSPLEMGTEGILLGTNTHRGITKDIHFATEDRVRHFYVIGQTGTGKTGALVNMIAQDIQNGEGVCYIDPHGTDIQTILSYIPPERHGDVIYFDPAYTERPMGLNMMEYDQSRPEQKTLVIDELMGIFNQLFDMEKQGGAMFQQYFKNSAFLVMDHPASGSTLLEVTRVLGDSEFRKMKLGHCTNPIIRQFWENAEKTTGDQSLANFVPYISSKFDPLISNDIMRPVVIQEKSAFNVREIMDNKKILLVNLAKGRLGEINANLIGLIIVGKIQMAALSRVDSYGKDFPPFYLYIDEFQNVTTPSIASILSEARKYKLSLNMAHQYMSQLSDGIKNAVLGNVGSMGIFRISPEDASILEPRLTPTFNQRDIIKQDNFNSYMSMLVDGQPVKPFNMAVQFHKRWEIPGNSDTAIDQLKQLSYQKFGRPRAEVEAEIMARYKVNE
ncbi:MAG: hypothetical protein ACI83D_000766 [Planctomycetota bacterium]|jgi:hypothetical protein